ncbi:MAG: DUF2834 domain-containing protein [Deltaproteobacteria bacterium]|nr:DUF2834 domain-containing protein [Deltaproteobacteria bacterium]
MGRNPLLSSFFLLLAIAGAVVPWTYNLLAAQEMGRFFTPVEFVVIGFDGPALLGSVAADFWIGSTAALVWMLVEARRLRMKYWWAFFPLTLLVAWACALPLFLFLRERTLARTAL